MNIVPDIKKLLYRSKYRGIKEMDFIMSRYSNENIRSMSDDELCDYEQILELDDHDLYKWIIGKDLIPQNKLKNSIEKIRKFYKENE